MPVNTEHAAYRELKPLWDTIRDTILGEQQIKKRGDKYLPRPNPTDVSEDNQARYVAYLTRAVFYNVVKRTLGGLVGQIYSRAPIIEVPKDLEIAVDDATGLGVSLIQLSKFAAGHTVSFGRSGLLVDYPDTEGGASKAEIMNGDIRPLFTLFDPKDIINWRTMRRGGRNVLSLVVLRESYVVSDDGFLETRSPQYRVLRLDNAGENYRIEIWRQDTQAPVQTINPTGSDGKPLNFIPFTFLGSTTNDPAPDTSPPLYDLASLNIAHYRNSADYEESCYITGQPTGWFSGLTEQWVKDILKGEIQLGSRAAIPLPAGAAAGMLQPDPNTLPFEAMKHKERQMVALGAKLVEPSAVQRTATEASIDQSYETSTLSASADNVSDAFTVALRWAAMFSGTTEEAELEKIKFELNTEFDLIKLSANERTALIGEWQNQAISWSEMRANLRRAGIATIDDEAAKQEIEKDAALLPPVGMEDDDEGDGEPPDKEKDIDIKASGNQPGPSNART